MRPKIGLMCDVKPLEELPFHAVGEEYLYAVMEGAGAWPVIIPAQINPTHAERSRPDYDFDAILAELDGIVLTGSRSNVAPNHYGADLAAPDILLDEQRDQVSLSLIRRAIAMGLPLLAICRGFQELNVAFGGTLHQNLDEHGAYEPHMPFHDRDVDGLYSPAHPVTILAGGLVSHLAGQGKIWVNSVHKQGIDRLADGLRVEAVAPDGLIEAVTVTNAPGFNLAVQWHPEFRFWDAEFWQTPLMPTDKADSDFAPSGDGGFSRRLFEAFGRAAQEYRAERSKSKPRRRRGVVVL